MARDGLFFAPAALANRHHVPGAAILAQGAWAGLLVLPMTVKGDGKFGNLYGDLLDYLIPVDVMFYTLMVGAVAVMRWKRRAGASVSNVALIRCR